MKKLRFKSNIKCMGCVEKVKPVLDGTEGIAEWHVDILTPEKILTVETELDTDEITRAVQKAGYKAEPLEDA